MIGVLILIAIFVVPSITWLVLLLAYIILVALYGSLTSDKMILLKQGGLAILTLITLLFGCSTNPVGEKSPTGFFICKKEKSEL